jgi:hypothetical protein
LYCPCLLLTKDDNYADSGRNKEEYSSAPGKRIQKAEEMVFRERDWSEWDRKIMRDSENGSLDFLAEEAMLEKKKGMLGEL